VFLLAAVLLFPMIAASETSSKGFELEYWKIDSAYFDDNDDGYLGFVNQSIKITYIHTNGEYMKITLRDPDGSVVEVWDPVDSTPYWPYPQSDDYYCALDENAPVETYKLEVYLEYEGSWNDYVNVDFVIIYISFDDVGVYPDALNYPS